jgi:1,4-alpha-glucan branching enzyme
MARGYLAIVLHAHLPFVRHPEQPQFLEEEWFFEAITETYIPLLLGFERLMKDGIDFRITISFSASLLAMLTDDLLKERYAHKLDKLIELGDKEIDRTWRHDRQHHELAKTFRHRFEEIRDCWRRYDGDLVRAYRAMQDAGKIEIITCVATHPFFPLLDRNWAAYRAQVNQAAKTYERLFGRRTQGIWLAECGYVPGCDELLREEGIRYFFVDTHGILFADPRPVFGVYAPIYCRSGVAAFGRDVESSKQVWSSKEGYPGDPNYRDFYRDIGFDLPMDYIRPYVNGDVRIFTGYKYHAITHASLHDKRPYDPHVAYERAASHAGNFLFNREKQIEHLYGNMSRKPIVVAPYDAELYGHWWYEGPMFLELLFRKMHYDQGVVAPITPSGYLAEYATNQVATPCTSSWGEKGYAEFWCDGSNAWVYRHLHKTGERMVHLAHRFQGETSDVKRRALNQAARELMLAQASDWAFIMKTGTTVTYATKRTIDHVTRFNRLFEGLVNDRVDDAFVAYLAEAERRDNLFPDVDYRVYAS